MFERTEIAESIYGGGALYQNTQQAEADWASIGRIKKIGASALPSKTEKGNSGKCKRNYAGHPSDDPTGAKNTCLLHGSRHSSEECRVLKEYTKKRSAQHPYKDKQACSGGNKRAKTVKFKDTIQEVNTMKSHDEPIPKKKKKKRRRKNPIVIRQMQSHQRMNALMELAD